MKKAMFAIVVTSFVTSLAFASVELSKESRNIQQQDQELIDQLNLEKSKEVQVLAILQQGQEEKLRIMQEAQDKIMQLQQKQQDKLNAVLGPQAQNLINEIKQEKVEKHRQKIKSSKG